MFRNPIVGRYKHPKMFRHPFVDPYNGGEPFLQSLDGHYNGMKSFLHPSAVAAMGCTLSATPLSSATRHSEVCGPSFSGAATGLEVFETPIVVRDNPP